MPDVSHVPRILIADDDLNSREMLYRMLNGYGEIAEAATGRQALDMLELEHFDVVILDALMPALTGIDVLKMVRAMPQLAHIPVIFLSEFVRDDPNMRGVVIDDADFLLKPIDIDELTARVEAHLSARG